MRRIKLVTDLNAVGIKGGSEPVGSAAAELVEIELDGIGDEV
jgi:hypothetical protein